MASTLTVDNIVGATNASSIHIPGHVIQVVEFRASTQLETTSASYLNTALTISITPLSNTSKILLSSRIPVRAGGYSYGSIRWTRNGSVIFQPNTSYEFGVTASGVDMRTVLSYSLLDSPTTTSTVTYTAQLVAYLGSSVSVMPNSNTGVVVLQEIAQ